MTIQAADVRRIAHLARIAIDDQDIERFAANLSAILEFVEQMNAVDTDKVMAMAHPQDAVQRLRPDVVTECNQREAFMRNAPLAESGLYLVPRVIE